MRSRPLGSDIFQLRSLSVRKKTLHRVSGAGHLRLCNIVNALNLEPARYSGLTIGVQNGDI